MISFCHSGNSGDCIYSLPCVLSLLKNNNQAKADYYLKIDQQAYYYNNSEHPLGNVKLNSTFAKQLIPLLESQYYINKTSIYEGQHVDVDLDEFRETNINQSQGYIARWYFYAFLADYNLSDPWLWVEKLPEYKDLILVNRTARYRNLSINYRFLQEYNNVVFIGLDKEYYNFKEEVPNAGHISCRDFLQMAQIINSCKLFIGNQSLAYALAEAVKVPRILEVCPYAPNIIPHGNAAWDVLTQPAFETTVKQYLSKQNA